jgi:hypothetical protein
MANYIQTRKGDLWSRKEAKWIDPAIWQTWGQAKLERDCGYPTFKGCNKVAKKLWGKYYVEGKSPYQWGAVKLNPNAE